MFVDQIKIYAKAGNGGDGAVSFRREKFVPKGGPDGGDGGRGGSIIFHADPHVDTLTTFFYEPILRAKNGEHGRGKQCYGKAAKDKHVKVPIGTLIYRLPPGASPFAPKKKEWEEGQEDEAAVDDVGDTADEADEPAADLADEADATDDPSTAEDGEETATVGGEPAHGLELVADLDHEGAQVVLCKGGDGGRGNIHFKSSRNRVPRQFTPGGEGEEGYFLLELRSIADAGLVGYPNAGKSTLLGKISSAHPKVAPYPFTTLRPVIGMVEFDGYRRAPVADIPGLIEGAHENVGLGHEFLRHIMRCRVLLFVVDMAGAEGRHPADDLAQLRRELSLYSPELPKRPWFVVANKMDDPNAAEHLAQFRQRFPKPEIVPISAELGEGIGELKTVLARYLFAEVSMPDAGEETPA